MGKQKRKKKTNHQEPLPGIALEQVVARIQQMMDPTSVVEHNQRLKDRVGNTRQYDVVIRGKFGGRDALGIIECKDHKRKKGPHDVEAFAKKCNNLGANMRLMVSKNGFTEQALRLAKHEHIGCLSLLANDTEQTGLSFGQWCYGIMKRWGNLTIIVKFESMEDKTAAGSFDNDDVKWQGKPILNWFRKKLYSKHKDKLNEIHPQIVECLLTFDQTRHLEIRDGTYPVKVVGFRATGVRKKKRFWVTWSGDAFYDWHSGSLSIPDKGVMFSSSIPSDLSEWLDYDGEIPNANELEFMQMIVNEDFLFTADAQVPDLSSL
jgi:hypothetical protein